MHQLAPAVYGELKRLASYYLRREPAGHTLQSTALVHEAYIRLVQQEAVNFQDRAHFFAICARMIRQILVDHARKKKAAKRGGGMTLVLEKGMEAAGRRELDLVRLDDALMALAQFDEQQSKIVEMRFFAGLSVEETAEVLSVSPRTVKREWASARAWLYRELSGEPA